MAPPLFEERPDALLQVFVRAIGSAAVSPAPADIAGEADQFVRVFAEPNAGVDHLVVAGALTFDAQAMKCIPHQRMEPITRGRHATDHLKSHVGSLDVGQFVEQNEPVRRALGPLVRLVWQENDGPPEPPRYRDLRTRTHSQLDWALDRDLPAEPVEQSQPGRVENQWRPAP